MELWRTNIDYSIIQTLEEIRRIKGKKFGFTDEYDVEITKDTAKLLLEKVRANLSLEEIILDTRLLANFLLGKNQKLSFNLKSIPVKEIFETQEMKIKVLSKSYRKLGMNKSTLWYQRQRLKESGSLRIYNDTKQYFRWKNARVCPPLTPTKKSSSFCSVLQGRFKYLDCLHFKCIKN